MRRRSRVRQAKFIAALVALIMVGGLLSGCGSSSSGITVNLYNGPQQNLGAIVKRCNTMAKGYRIKLNTLPRDADGQREQLVRRLAAKDRGLDVMDMDITWTAEFAAAGWIREWTGKNKTAVENGTLPAPLDVASWENRLYAAPYNTNVQLLWYRADLVPNPPKTWDELIASAQQLKAAGKPHYAEVTGAQYEGLVVWFNALVTSAGGQILNDAGTKDVLDDHALTALKVMRKFARSVAADPSLSNTQEQQSNLAMQGGSAAYQVIWPFVYAALRDAKVPWFKDLRWAPYPGIDGPGKSPLGGAEFAVGKYSKHPQQAFQAAMCLRDFDSQKTAAIEDGLPPTLEAVYSDPAMDEAYPMKQAILDALKTAGQRPSTPSYQNVSTTIAAILSPPRAINPSPTLKKLKDQIDDALNSKGVLP